MKKQILNLMTIAISLLVIMIACKKDIHVTGITLNKATLTLEVGATETLIATIQPTDATNKNTTWESSNVAVATVLNGFVTAVTPGTATITVRTEDGNKTATCTVTVEEREIAVTGVTLNKTTLTLEIGATETLIATIQPANATNQLMTWESSNITVATVQNGVVAALTPGTATITVRTEDGNKTATCAVIVEEPISRVDLLTQEKGWKITAATCDPPYELWIGDPISNLFNGYFWDCELDDIIFFLKDKTQFLDPGKKLCDNYPSGNLGNWDLLDNEQKLQFHFLDIEGLFEATILILDKTTLKLSLAMEEDDGMKTSPKYRGVRGDSKTVKNYVFTLTYTKP